ncbi:tyrosine-type recombinase/integrase [Faecalicoccus pleomorphus]|uniref:site-specific integrase n=1 Tax=Faecalicoccus pleomorphus TaxID=1323 RepID=UPI00294234E4|nr:tyrosine-type recombinase/integrase [Faecalicoccus pleomorphus]
MFARPRKAKKAKSGFTWTVYLDYTDSCGIKQRYSKGGFKTKKEALEHGGEIQQKLSLNGGELYLCERTFNEVFEEYLEVEGKYKYASSTMRYYQFIHQKHIKKSIGFNKMNNLRYKNVQTYFNSLDELGKETCTSIKKVFNVTFKYAIKNGYILSNPMPMIETRGRDTSRKHGIIEYHQLEEMVSLILEDYHSKKVFSKLSYCIFLYLGFFLGTRKAETLALTKDDIDFEHKQISINKQLVYHGIRKEEYYCKDALKTKCSNANIPLCAKLSDILQEWIVYNPYDLLCCNEDGSYIIPTDLERYLKKIGKKIGIEFHPHMLRHSFVTNLIRSGIDVKTVSELARHSEVTTTMNIYAQTTECQKQEAINHAFNDDLFKKSYKKVTNLEISILN